MPAIDPISLPLPGASRLRNLTPLTGGDGACPLICDLERGSVVSVPVEFQLHVAQVLDTGEPDEALLGWLMSAGLWTAEEGGHGQDAKPRRGCFDCGRSMTMSSIVAPAELVRGGFEAGLRTGPGSSDGRTVDAVEDERAPST